MFAKDKIDEGNLKDEEFFLLFASVPRSVVLKEVFLKLVAYRGNCLQDGECSLLFF